MKKTLQSLFILILLLHLNACQQKQFGHLSKVRVKQKDLVSKQADKQKNHNKPQDKEAEELQEETTIASSEANPVTVFGSTRNIIGKKQKVEAAKAEAKKTPTAKKVEKNKQHKKDNPYPNKPNIPVYVGIVLSALSLTLIGLDIFVYNEGFLFLIAGFLSIAILILGIIGLSNYKREKATDGYIASILLIIFGSLFMALFLFLIIFFIIIILTGGLF